MYLGTKDEVALRLTDPDAGTEGLECLPYPFSTQWAFLAVDEELGFSRVVEEPLLRPLPERGSADIEAAPGVSLDSVERDGADRGCTAAQVTWDVQVSGGGAPGPGPSAVYRDGVGGRGEGNGTEGGVREDDGLHRSDRLWRGEDRADLLRPLVDGRGVPGSQGRLVDAGDAHLPSVGPTDSGTRVPVCGGAPILSMDPAAGGRKDGGADSPRGAGGASGSDPCGGAGEPRSPKGERGAPEVGPGANRGREGVRAGSIRP